ncbi:hypothetical protein [Aquabacterium sp. CECT 9606]|uniref:hypothetical protein n=1 Tax=Aquabacterium sp. CECT 9606 TaxID=2845822 RepID=UPI001E3D3CFC|nr:hypothetical protein [Aquabacterium sp. CECT 9606]CAH0352945.1 hypothetical protein AQB9606_02939 [Aquabacterium sp. CECT 9606]
MRKVSLIILGFLLVLTTSVKSAQAELDMDLMQAIEDTNKSLSSNIAIKDQKASTSDAKELEQMFSKVETYFVEKGDAPDAVDLAKKSKELSLEIVKSVTAQDFDSATNAATTISRNCRTCHTFYKKS